MCPVEGLVDKGNDRASTATEEDGRNGRASGVLSHSLAIAGSWEAGAVKREFGWAAGLWVPGVPVFSPANRCNDQAVLSVQALPPHVAFVCEAPCP